MARPPSSPAIDDHSDSLPDAPAPIHFDPYKPPSHPVTGDPLGSPPSSPHMHGDFPRPPPTHFDDDFSAPPPGEEFFSMPSVTGWVDAAQPRQVLGMNSGCKYDTSAEGGYGSLLMDGKECLGMLPSDLANWSTSSESAFTIVVIYKLGYNYGDTALVQMSRSTSDYNSELLFGSETFLHDEGIFSMTSDGPELRPDVWAFNAFVRNEGGTSGAMFESKGDAVHFTKTWRDQEPISIGADHFVLGADYRDWDRFLAGRVAVALVYNRALDIAQLNRIFEVYTPRFDWMPQLGPLCSIKGLVSGPYGNRTGGTTDFDDSSYADAFAKPIQRIAWAINGSITALQLAYGPFSAPIRGGISEDSDSDAVNLREGEYVIFAVVVLGMHDGYETVDGILLTTNLREVQIGAEPLTEGTTTANATPCPSEDPAMMMTLQNIAGTTLEGSIASLGLVWSEVPYPRSK
ncbi:hypothetical protein HYH03_011905 [Edaphochlamys debaryana]|uniref:Uncharacterized protein n=1 Tax=Edaphochlamys debaryana TaxID=47281 RepID=A0A836BUJ2_9CHLO|nr:hypothetical protein HYH03_011905 [Edaphochlamys debaryana]|eukprot:KAG2489626.1 hypothetical protein HYH03_011905 [Edaphochlamys debaryana]